MFNCRNSRRCGEGERAIKVLGIQKRDFIDFLTQAKKAGYASGIKPERDRWTGEKVFRYEKSISSKQVPILSLNYEDRYSGYFKATGREIISIANPSSMFRQDPIINWNAVWTMSYGFHPEDGMQGKFARDKEMTHETFTFLKQALSNPDKDRPLRGPIEFEEGNFTYNFNPSGYVDGFEGIEYVAYHNLAIFKQHISGGLIQHKNLEIELV